MMGCVGRPKRFLWFTWYGPHTWERLTGMYALELPKGDLRAGGFDVVIGVRCVTCRRLDLIEPPSPYTFSVGGWNPRYWRKSRYDLFALLEEEDSRQEWPLVIRGEDYNA